MPAPDRNCRTSSMRAPASRRRAAPPGRTAQDGLRTDQVWAQREGLVDLARGLVEPILAEQHQRESRVSPALEHHEVLATDPDAFLKRGDGTGGVVQGGSGEAHGKQRGGHRPAVSRRRPRARPASACSRASFARPHPSSTSEWCHNVIASPWVCPSRRERSSAVLVSSSPSDGRPAKWRPCPRWTAATPRAAGCRCR